MPVCGAWVERSIGAALDACLIRRPQAGKETNSGMT